MQDLDKVPFPWFGGKSKAAKIVWEALGDVENYVEPFCGSCAVLLNRPHLANRTYFSETLNDVDGMLVNAWRAMQLKPNTTAKYASNPVFEIDLHARHSYMTRWKSERQLEHLLGDPKWCDPMIAGWWIWGICCWIGGEFCSGKGPWVADETGRLCKKEKSGVGILYQKPELNNDGRGVNRPQTREPGVGIKCSKPQFVTNGQGVNRPQTREPGVGIQCRRPDLSCNGRGVNHAGTREPGVGIQCRKPELISDGQGVNHAGTREPGVAKQSGLIVNQWTDDPNVVYHPVTMPEVKRWFQYLSARLRHVRVCCGDWKRICTPAVLYTLSVRMGKGGHTGLFFDPPYSEGANRENNIYTHDSLDVGKEVVEWALKQNDERLRIVIAGFEGEYGKRFEKAGWREVEWFKGGFLSGGMGNIGKGKGGPGHQQKRERLWLSPTCLAKKKAYLF